MHFQDMMSSWWSLWDIKDIHALLMAPNQPSRHKTGHYRMEATIDQVDRHQHHQFKETLPIIH